MRITQKLESMIMRLFRKEVTTSTHEVGGHSVNQSPIGGSVIPAKDTSNLVKNALLKKLDKDTTLFPEKKKRGDSPPITAKTVKTSLPSIQEVVKKVEEWVPFTGR